MREAQSGVSDNIGQLGFDELLLGLEKGGEGEEALRRGGLGGTERGVIILLHAAYYYYYENRERDFVIFQLSIYLNFFMLDKILDELLFLYQINHFYYFL